MVNFSRVFSTALNNILSRPILLILMSFFVLVVIAELEYIDDKPTTLLVKSINETKFGGKFLKKIVVKVEENLYFLTLAYGLLVLGIFITGVRYLFFIHILVVTVLAGLDITKETFITVAILIIIEYLYFVIKIFMIRIVLLIAFLASFYIELEFKTKEKKKNDSVPAPMHNAKNPASRT